MTPQDIGMVAGFLTTASFIPQVVAIWHSKNADAISLPMYSIFLVGIALWFVFGWQSGSLPVMLYNAITFILALAILVMKIAFSRSKPAQKSKL